MPEQLTKRAAKQLKVTKLVLVVVGVITLLVISWFAWGPPSQPKINSYEECVAQGYPMLAIYPGRCTTKDGRTFTDPNYDHCLVEPELSAECAKKRGVY